MWGSLRLAPKKYVCVDMTMIDVCTLPDEIDQQMILMMKTAQQYYFHKKRAQQINYCWRHYKPAHSLNLNHILCWLSANNIIYITIVAHTLNTLIL